MKTLNETIKFMKGLELSAKKINDIMHDVADVSMIKVGESFDKEKDALGKKWVPLSQKTLKNKRRNSKILKESGMLKDSINARVVDDNRVRIGSSLKYARIHQLGGKAGRGLSVDIPARPFLPVINGEMPSDLSSEIEDIVLTHLKIKKK